MRHTHMKNAPFPSTRKDEIGLDVKAKVTTNDTTTDFLDSKIVAGTGISKTVLNPGANETLEISAPGSTTDEKVKASPADTTPGELDSKITLSTGLSGTILNPGGDESLEITNTVVNTDINSKVSAADTTTGYLNDKITVDASLLKAIVNPAGNETLNLSILAVPPELQPQWIGAGAWAPRDSNTYLNYTALDFTGSEQVIYNTIRYDSGTSDGWFFTTIPPTGWTSGKIKFIPHYIAQDALGTPGTMIFELGGEYMADEFDPDTDVTWQNITSTKTAGSATVPQYIIGTESAELILGGSPAASGALALRLKRLTDTESDPLYIVGIKLIFVN